MLQASTVNDVRTYNVTGGKYSALPAWMARESKKKLKGDAAFEQRVRLLEDFSFPTASTGMAYTPDGDYLVAWGTYKPRFKVYALRDMTMKFERHTDCDTVAACCLSTDWTKLALLQSDRFVEFHGPSGLYERVRIPRVGRCLHYNDLTGELLLGATGKELFRLSLERGQFKQPWALQGTGANALAQAPFHGLLAVGQDSAAVELFDPRQHSRALALRENNNNGGEEESHLLGGFRLADSDDVTALAFLRNGLQLAVGSGDGVVSVWDVRGPKTPLTVRDHRHGLPIRRIRTLATRPDLLLSSDSKGIKIFDILHPTTPLMTHVASESAVNDFCADDASGLLLLAVEQPEMQAHFVPALGPAPRWCAFLDHLAGGEDAEGRREGKDVAKYDDYKFVTKAELAAVGLDSLVGTGKLKAYLHGFIVDAKVYDQAKAATNPVLYDEYVQRQRLQRLHSQSRLQVSHEDAKDDRKKRTKGSQRRQLMAQDARFRQALTDDAFRNDSDDEEQVEAKNGKARRRYHADTSSEED